MLSHKYKRSHYDYCVYFNKVNDGPLIYLLFYVDNILIVFTNKMETAKLKEKVSKEFEIKDLSETKRY